MEDDVCAKLAHAMAKEMEGHSNLVVGEALVLLLAGFIKTICDDDGELGIAEGCMAIALDAAVLANKKHSTLQ